MTKSITCTDFLQAFGETEAVAESVRQGLEELTSTFDLAYRELDEQELERCLVEILTKIEGSTFDASGSDKIGKWEDGWSENLSEFVDSGFDATKLIPKYYRHATVSRYDGRLILTNSPSFQYDFFQVLRFYITKRFLASYFNIFEFACGPGHNIHAMDAILANEGVTFHGLDWAASSVEIIEKIALHKGVRCRGKLFDFFKPDYSFDIPAGSAVLTYGGLEQVGANHRLFVEFLLEKKPAVCINIEPIHELYDTRKLLDFLANSYHHRRNYLKNYLSHLLLLEKQGKVAIDKVVRVPFGGMYHDGWSIVAWRPQ